MKICPFISHMMGEERATILEVEGERKSNADADGSQSHLFCLQETCRFYRTDSHTCQFDDILELTRANSEGASSMERSSAAVSRDLDKFWKFQTKSVAELISSFGDVEKRQDQALSDLRSELSDKLSELEKKQPKVDLKPFREDLVELQEALLTREEGIDDLSTALSETLLNVQEEIKAMKERHEDLVAKINETGSGSVREEIEAVVEEKIAGAFSELNERFESWDERLGQMVARQTALMEAVKAFGDGVRDKKSERRQKDAKKLNNLGVASFHNGELELARKQFLESIAIDESFAEAHNNLGLVCSELGDEDAASNAFSKAIELDPELHAAYNNLGYLFYKQNSYDQAVEMYNEALGRQSDNSAAYTNLGNAYYKLGRHEEAQAAWEKAMELDPTNEKAGRSLRRLEV